MSSPVLAFTNYTKDFLLETDASKEELGAVLSQKQAEGQFHLVTWQLGTNSPQKELPLHQIGVSGIKMGHHRTF